MIMSDRRKKIAAIMTGKAGQEVPLKPEYESDPDKAALKAVAEDVISAINGGSASDLAQALKAFISQCKG